MIPALLPHIQEVDNPQASLQHIFPTLPTLYSISSVPTIHLDAPGAACYCRPNTVCFLARIAPMNASLGGWQHLSRADLHFAP